MTISVAIPPSGFTVPTGSPEALREASRSLVAGADVLDGTVHGFDRAIQACDPGTWLGLAGLAFRNRVGQMKSAVWIGASSLRDGATALSHLADQLEAAQRRAREQQASAQAAAGMMVEANLALLRLEARDSDPVGRIRLLQDFDEAESNLGAARTAGLSAEEDARYAARIAAAALDGAQGRAKAPPKPPDRDMEPTETPGQFIVRQMSDIVTEPLNQFANGLSGPKEFKISAEWAVGIGFGGAEVINKGYALNAKKRIDGYWSKLPTVVAAHERTLPSGRKVPVRSYVKRDGTYVPGRTIVDQAKQAHHHARAKNWRNASFGAGFALAAFDQAVDDAGRRDLDYGDRVLRMVLGTGIGGLTSAGGAFAGATIGTGTSPGIGTVAGGTVGGMIGGGLGDKLKGVAFYVARVD